MKTWTNSARYWMGKAPTNCNLCSDPIDTTFIDGATIYGPWACMCTSCFDTTGRGVGCGRGQTYEKQYDGRWLKVYG